MFSSIREAPDESALKKHFSKEMQSFKAKQTKIKNDLSKLEKQLEKLEAELPKTLTGESVYSPELLSKSIKNVEAQIAERNEKLETLSNDITDKKSSMQKVKPLYERFKGWSEEFSECTNEQKKMIISQIIDRIEIGRDYKVNFVLNMTYKQFCENWNVLNE